MTCLLCAHSAANPQLLETRAAWRFQGKVGNNVLACLRWPGALVRGDHVNGCFVDRTERDIAADWPGPPTGLDIEANAHRNWQGPMEPRK